MRHDYPAWAEIDLSAIRNNFQNIKKIYDRNVLLATGKGAPVSRRALLAVIKADAYGHGMIKVAGVLDRLGVDFFGVSDVAEGVELRKNGFKRPVLLFESTLPVFARDLVEFNLTPSICTLAFAQALNACARGANRRVAVHIKIDTGMGRLGVWHHEALDFIRQVRGLSHLTVEGLSTHFPKADTDPDFTRRQIMEMEILVRELAAQGLSIRYVHAANSMGLAGYHSPVFTLARPGLMLYGLYPDQRARKLIDLVPAMSVRARVIFLKSFKKGQGVSYNHTFVTPRAMTMATLALGYSDGYMRCLSNKAAVVVDGQRCPVVGNVTMDQTMVDVTRVKTAKLGMFATVLGREATSEVSADELARHAGTINYEIVCNLGNRLPRVYKGK